MTSPPKDLVPAWARDAVWYQIFPERFRNGAPQSNPRPADTGHRDSGSWHVTPWGHDWYARDDWAKDGEAFYRYVYHRRYGGDLVGVREKLDYLKDLGINAIYFNPLFVARSLHKYDGSSFHHIDPTFGPDRDGDLAALAAANETEDPASWIWTQADLYFLELVTELHGRGIRVIIDGVFNHTGREFFAFQDLLKHGRRSRYIDWYKIKEWHDDLRFSYEGWYGHQSLPELAQTEDSLAPPVRDYVHEITRRWMKPNGPAQGLDGVDGWRLDVAFCVPLGFWRSWRAQVKALNPEAYTTAEIVTQADEYLQGDTFDAVMNYMWLYAAVAFFTPGEGGISASACRAKLDELRHAYPLATQPVLQNLLDSHDVARILTVLDNPGLPKLRWEDYFDATRAKHKPDLTTTRPGDKALHALRPLVIFQMTYVGAPMIYYGTEVGMWGANDPDNRQPMLWDDVAYAAEQTSPRGQVEPSARTCDKELLAFYKQAIALRKAHPALRSDAVTWIETEHPRLLAYERSGEGQRMAVFLNAGEEPLRCALPWPGRDLWQGGQAEVSSPIDVPGCGWRIIERV